MAVEWQTYNQENIGNGKKKRLNHSRRKKWGEGGPPESLHTAQNQNGKKPLKQEQEQDKAKIRGIKRKTKKKGHQKA